MTRVPSISHGVRSCVREVSPSAPSPALICFASRRALPDRRADRASRDSRYVMPKLPAPSPLPAGPYVPLRPQICFQGAAGERGPSGVRGFPVSSTSSGNSEGLCREIRAAVPSSHSAVETTQVPAAHSALKTLWPASFPRDPGSPWVTWRVGEWGPSHTAKASIQDKGGQRGTEVTFVLLYRASRVPQDPLAPKASQENR